MILCDLHPDFPVVIAANRDEFYSREATGPLILDADAGAVGGRDLRSGGTWMGVTAGGFFAGLTNQRTYTGPIDGLASRGPLVARALSLGSTAAVRQMLRELDGRTINSFNLLYGDAGGLEVAYGRADRTAVDIATVPTGLTVLPNDRLDSPEFPKVARARELVAPAARAPWPTLRQALIDALADHQKPALADVDDPPRQARFDRDFVRELHALCIHTPAYGTRSSTLVALAPGAVAHYQFADGPPCQAAFTDHTDLVSNPAPID